MTAIGVCTPFRILSARVCSIPETGSSNFLIQDLLEGLLAKISLTQAALNGPLWAASVSSDKDNRVEPRLDIASSSHMGSTRSGALKPRLQRRNFVQQIQRQRHAGRIEFQVARQPRCQPRTAQGRAREAPLTRLLTGRLKHPFKDPDPRIREFQSKSEQLPSLIVAFSANDDPESCARYISCGFDRCLSKPCSPRDVLALLKTESILEGPEQAEDTVVSVDRDLLPEVASFLATSRDLLAQMQTAILARDHEIVRRLAHKLAGSFAVFGFEWAASTCKEIEKSAGTDPSALVSIKAKAEALAQHLDTVEVRPLN